jgi:hypothetical protein
MRPRDIDQMRLMAHREALYRADSALAVQFWHLMATRDVASALERTVAFVQRAAEEAGLPHRAVSLAPEQPSRAKYKPVVGVKPTSKLMLTCPGCGLQRVMSPSKVADRRTDMCKPCAAKNRTRRLYA